MDPETMAAEFSRLQAEQNRLRDDARFLIEQADRLAAATEILAEIALRHQPPPRPPGRRASHRRAPEPVRLRLRLIRGGVAAAVAVALVRRSRLAAGVRRNVWTATAASVAAAVATGAAGALVAVLILPSNPGPPAGGPTVTISRAAGDTRVHHARRRRRTSQPAAHPSVPAGSREGSAKIASPAPSPVPAPPHSPAPSLVPSVCVLGICLRSG